MRNAVLFPVLFLAVTACQSAREEAPFSPPRTLSPAEKSLSNKGNDFSLRFFKQAAATGEKNLFLSPLSAYLALGMVANGTANTTATELLTALGHPEGTAGLNSAANSLQIYLETADPAVTFLSKNGVFYRNTFTFRPAFFETVRTHYAAEVRGLDYDSPDAPVQINRWVHEATRGRIPTIVDRISPDDVMHLVNALYFQARWRYRFDREKTTNRLFTTPAGAKMVPFMEVETDVMAHAASGFVLARLPYAGNAYEMVLLLPTAGAMPELLQSLQSSSLEQWLAASENSKVSRTLRLPSFKIEYSRNLIPDLQALGITALFDTRTADLSQLSSQNGLFVSSVLQKTWIQVDEAGTEAAAVTAVTVGVTSMPLHPVPDLLVFDRPFVYLIRERYSGTIAFAGILADPSPEN